MKTIEQVWIIDDEPIMNEVVRRMLSKTNSIQNIQMFEYAEDALEALRQMKATDQPGPDMILLDLNMPIMDGWQFMEQFKQLPQVENNKLFVLSSSINNSDIARALNLSLVKDYISKPLTYDKLQNILAVHFS